jgi:hypothetical protein
MGEHFFNILTAYAIGTAVTAGFVRLVWLMPIDKIAKHFLSWVMPVPAICIVLVLLYYGPSSSLDGEKIPAQAGDVARYCLFGALSAFALYAMVPVTKFVWRRLTGEKAAEEDIEDE